MKAVVTREPLPAIDPRSLIDAELPPPPAPKGRDLLVAVRAVSVNPLDTKQRMNRYGSPAAAGERILGWDAAGVVQAVGESATLFRPGDEVYYAGSIARPGSNAELQLVDERIVGPKPRSLDFAAAAALPLTSITAHEAIVDRLLAREGESLLVIAGAGGVGSMAIQIGRMLGLRVIATASRPESRRWCLDLGASQVIDHRRPLAEGLREAGVLQAGRPEVDNVLNCAELDRYWPQMAEVVKPQGALCSIVANEAPVDLKAIQRKCARFAFEAMFSRSLFDTPDLIEQHRLLARVARWVDEGRVRGTATEVCSPICARGLREAHARVESRAMIGKFVLHGW